MRIVFKQCRYCFLSNNCEYKKNIKKQISVSPKLKGYTFTTDCKIYGTFFKIDEKVLINVYDFDIENSEWIDLGKFNGTVVGYQKQNKKYYIIKLDIGLNLIRRKNKHHLPHYLFSWPNNTYNSKNLDDYERVTIHYIAKYAKEIESQFLKNLRKL